jgi:hypothetical protein
MKGDSKKYVPTRENSVGALLAVVSYLTNGPAAIQSLVGGGTPLAPGPALQIPEVCLGPRRYVP